ncbi:hypothetical protein CDAR_313911 [Caerostris darwini]|uniref:Uncharacterized protein n=1 Tax=Caerostris darwini TaxID=1538125 RepID=A0AAV4QLW6_9ARAC|nr:hypothetical protein CDAR_313911 [Caerostris darwini]
MQGSHSPLQDSLKDNSNCNSRKPALSRLSSGVVCGQKVGMIRDTSNVGVNESFCFSRLCFGGNSDRLLIQFIKSNCRQKVQASGVIQFIMKSFIGHYYELPRMKL